MKLADLVTALIKEHGIGHYEVFVHELRYVRATLTWLYVDHEQQRVLLRTESPRVDRTLPDLGDDGYLAPGQACTCSGDC